MKGIWWCPNCEREVDARNVTYQERHDFCGYPVKWLDGILEEFDHSNLYYFETIGELKNNFPDDENCVIYVGSVAKKMLDNLQKA